MLWLGSVRAPQSSKQLENSDSAGQRYHVIVEANPINSDQTNFWMRTDPVSGCGTFKWIPGLNGTRVGKTGIIRYRAGDTALPTTKANFTESATCRDQDYNTLKPIHPWTIGDPVNYGIPPRSSGVDGSSQSNMA